MMTKLSFLGLIVALVMIFAALAFIVLLLFDLQTWVSEVHHEVRMLKQKKRKEQQKEEV